MSITRGDLRRIFAALSRDAEPRDQVDRGRRWCACSRPVPSRRYMGQWVCACNAQIETRRPWAGA